MNDGGWVKLHRRIRKSAVWQNPNVRTFWVWALLKAAHTEHVATVEFKRITLQPGQFLYNHPMASMETGLSQKTVRNCLEFLKSGDTPEIGQAQGSLPGNRYSIITINNWARYQGDDSGEGRQKAGAGVGKGQAEGSLTIMKKNVKKHRSEIAPVDIAWDGEKLSIPDVLMAKYRAKYPRLDISSIAVDAERWLLKHPAKAASYKSFDAFLNNWLRNEAAKTKVVPEPVDDYEISEADAALQLQFECDLAAGRAVHA